MEIAKKVLVVDDDPAVALALVDSLQTAGYDVTSKHDGTAGLDAALSTHPDIILTDLKMPGMGGLDMIKELRKDEWGKTAKVVILSNQSDFELLQTAMEFEAFHYLVKGDAHIDDIIATVRQSLEEH